MAPVKILVVDNEEDQRRLMQTVLERLGYAVATTASAEAALRAIASEPYRLVLADLIMPGMEGTELCERIKREQPQIRVFAFSGHAGLYPKQRLEESGFDGIIEKPLKIAELKAAVEAALEA